MSKRQSWTARRRRLFLHHLRASANVSAAAAVAGLSRSSAYALRRRDEGFRRDWEDAIEGALDDLEAELRRRAIEGVEKPVYFGGKQCGVITSYNDNLGMFLLRSRRPDVFAHVREENTRPAERDTPADASDESNEAVTRHLVEARLAELAGQTDENSGEDNT